MFILIYISLVVICYVVTFKDDFSDENISKAGPFIAIVSVVLVLIGIIGSLGR